MKEIKLRRVNFYLNKLLKSVCKRGNKKWMKKYNKIVYFPKYSVSVTKYILFCSTGIALDGHLKDEDVNLASSTLIGDGKSPSDAMGIVISYSMRIKVNCGTLGGELMTDVPFKMMHPAPGKYF